MKIRHTYIYIVLLAVAILATSCSKFNRIQKSSDMNLKYEAAIKYYDKKKYYQALQLLEELIVVFKGTDKAENAYYYYCLSYFYSGDYVSAAYHFNNFAQTFPLSPRAEEASFYNAYCYYLDSAPSSLDQQSTYDALKQFQLFVNRYPTSTHVAECNKLMDELRLKLEDKAYDIARLYYKTEDYKAAIVALSNVVKDFPASKYREECLFLTLKSAYLYAGNSIESKKVERYQNTIEQYTRLIEAFPSTQYLKEADKIKAQSQDKINQISTLN